MNITVLDLNTITNGDLDLSPIEKLGNVSYFDILAFNEVVEACADAEIVLTNKTEITKELMLKLPKLKYVGLFATGYNNVDLDHAKENGIAVCNVPGYSTDSVAQLVFAYILSLTTSLPTYNESVKRGDWVRSSTFAYFPYYISELAGKTLGIIGYGAIGKKVAEIGNAFGMKINIYSRRKYDDCVYPQVTKEELFKNADYVSVNCPLNEGTAELINSSTLSLMKKTAYLINTARGGIVNSKDLADALNNDIIAGAGIDVLPQEPMNPDEPLLKAKNCMLSPHIGWASIEARRRLILKVAENISAWQSGNPINVVNP